MRKNKSIVGGALILLCFLCACSQENRENETSFPELNVGKSEKQEFGDTLKRNQLFKYFESTSPESVEEVSYRMYEYFCNYPEDVIRDSNQFNSKLRKFNLTISGVLCNEIFIQYEGHSWSEKELDKYLNQLFKDLSSVLKSEVRECILE